MKAPLGCYTNPVNIPMQHTIPVPPKSALDHTMGDVYWHPQVHIDVIEARFLRVPEYFEASFRGVESFIRYKKPAVETKSKPPVKRIRIQRSLIRNLDIVVGFNFIPNQNEGGTLEHVIKAEQIFYRRLRKGQCFRLPCAGQQMFPASLHLSHGNEKPVAWDLNVGRLPFVVPLYKQAPQWGMSHPAEVKNGVLEYPSLAWWGF
jgi:hypothetical protein